MFFVYYTQWNNVFVLPEYDISIVVALGVNVMWPWLISCLGSNRQIVEYLRDRDVACLASDRQDSNFESCVWRAVSSHSPYHPQEIILAQCSVYVHKGGLKPHSFHLDKPRNTKGFIEKYKFEINDSNKKNGCFIILHATHTQWVNLENQIDWCISAWMPLAWTIVLNIEWQMVRKAWIH